MKFYAIIRHIQKLVTKFENLFLQECNEIANKLSFFIENNFTIVEINPNKGTNNKLIELNEPEKLGKKLTELNTKIEKLVDEQLKSYK